MTPNDVVILCGGLGTRLQSVVRDLPKPMARVAGRPFLEIVLSQLFELGASRAILSTGYLATMISDYFGDRFRTMELRYSQDPQPLGTGGAARAGAALCETESILVCNGDTYIDFDLSAARVLADRSTSPVVIALKVPDTERYGRIEIDESNTARFRGRGISGAGFISGGVYLLPKAMLLADARPTPFSMEDFVFEPNRPGVVLALEARGRFIDIGVPEDYAAAQSMFGSSG